MVPPVKNSPLRDLFCELDADGSGSIDVAELEIAFHKLGLITSSQGKSEFEALIQRVDSSRDGKVEYDEFEEAFGYLVANGKQISLKVIAAKWMSLGDVDMGSDIAVSGSGAHDNLKSGKQQFPLWYFICAGGVAGVISRSATAPLERVKIQLQVGPLLEAISGNKPLSASQLLQQQYKASGFRGLFAGNGANCVRIFPLMGLSCLFYGQINKSYVRYSGRKVVSPTERFYAGVIAGGLANSLTYPMDVVRARLSAPSKGQVGQSIPSVCRDIVEQGAAFRGLGVTLITAAPMMGLIQSSYDFLKDEIIIKRQMLEPSPYSFSLIGACAGIFAQSVVYPMDTLRRRLQVSSGTSGSNLTRAPMNFQDFRSLYRGLPTAIAKVMPGVAISLTVRDGMLGRW